VSSRASEPETVYASKTLASCLSLLFSRPAAEVMDLGPVVGSNVAFLGDRVGCKIHVEDLYADIDRHIKHDKLDQLPRFLSGRFPLPDASIDAVLGWDIFDYIDPLAARALAEELVRLLRPGGVLLAFFGAVASDHPRYVKYFIEDAAHLRSRSYPAPRRRWVLQNRDISRMFVGLELCDSVLLKSGVREMLFRKRFC
jgi:SAM-dependent methyltransferase